nr:hypothetical protein [Tanacetum cinerariifolium]
MSIMLSRIAKVQSFDETLEAFDKLEIKLSQGNPFGTEEFNLLLRAFCTKRQMREARSVFNRLYSRFTPTTKTSNILLLGFKESGDVTSVELFYDDMIRRGFSPDTKTSGNVMSATRVMNEMEENNILPDHSTFHTMFSGLINSSGINGVLPLYYQMIGKNFVPYLIERGDCPHSHAVVVLLKGLCSERRVEEGFQCGLQILEKGRFLSKTRFRVLERFLLEMGDEVKLRKLNRMIKKLQIAVPASRGHAMGISV